MTRALSFTLVVLIGCTSHTQRVVTCEGIPKPVGAYSPAVQSGHRVYVSGQISLTSDGKLDSSSFTAECTQALRNIDAILKCAEKTSDEVCKTTVYLTSLKNYKELNEVYYSYFAKNVPAREVVEVRALPRNAHVEISVVAR